MPKKFNQAPTILLHPGQVSGRSFYRVFNPASKLQKAGYARFISYFQPLDSDALKKINPNVVVFDTWHTDPWIEAIRRYRAVLKDAFFVFEIDDLFTEVPKDSIHRNSVPPDIKKRLRVIMNLCDCVTTTTEPLAEYWRTELKIKDVRVLPNMIPKEVFDNFSVPTLRIDDKIRIGWAGGDSHTGDLKIIKEVIEKIGPRDDIQWVFMGMKPEGIDPKLIEFHKHVEIQNYFQALKGLNLDIGLAPLEMNRFNECKSNLRLLEYGACGFAAITTTIEPYISEIYTGLPTSLMSVENTVFAWTSIIEGMLKSKDLISVGKVDLQNWVQKNYCLDDHLEKRMEGWLRNGDEMFKPIGIDKNKTKGFVIYQMNNDENHPAEFFESSDILCVRPGCDLTENQIMRISSFQQDKDSNIASVSVLSNDGGIASYQSLVHFNPMIKDQAKEIESIVSQEPKNYIPIHRSSGPAILLTAEAISKIGLPLDDYEFLENAIMDWCLRASEMGFKHVVDTTVFAHVTLPGEAQRFNEDFEKLQARFPWSIEYEKKAIQSDPLNKVRESLDLKYHGANFSPPNSENSTYTDWVKAFDTIDEIQIEYMKAAIEKMALNPKIGIIVIAESKSTEDFKKTINSIGEQIYENWHFYVADYENCSKVDAINQAIGEMQDANSMPSDSNKSDWIMFIETGDTLAPNALFEIARHINLHPEGLLFYCDEDRINDDGNRCEPYFKPNFDKELLSHYDYVSRGAVYKYEWYGEHSKEELNKNEVVHIPHILYHLQGMDEKQEIINKTIQHLDIKPFVSIIIPSLCGNNTIKPCISSILNNTDYTNYEIIVIANNKYSKEGVKWIESIRSPTIRILKYNSDPFNFSKTVNLGVKQAKGSYVLLMNDDTIVAEKSWLTNMVGNTVRDGIGAVGPKLIYSNGHIQSVGDTKIEHGALHLMPGLEFDSMAYFGYAQMNHEAYCIPAACLLVKKSVYEEVGGFDETKYPIYFNDVDFGIRLYNAGYRNIVVPNSVIVHNESTTLGKNQDKKVDDLRYSVNFLNKDHPEPDPYLNPNLQPNGKFNSLIWNPSGKRHYFENRQNVLAVNPQSDDFKKNHIGCNCFIAVSSGVLMKIIEPNMINAYPWDCRGNVDGVKETLKKLNIKRIAFYSLGDGAIEILAFVAKLGLPIEYMNITSESKCPRMDGKDCTDKTNQRCQSCIDEKGSQFGYVDCSGWFSSWERFFSSENVDFVTN